MFDKNSSYQIQFIFNNQIFLFNVFYNINDEGLLEYLYNHNKALKNDEVLDFDKKIENLNLNEILHFTKFYNYELYLNIYNSLYNISQEQYDSDDEKQEQYKEEEYEEEEENEEENKEENKQIKNINRIINSDIIRLNDILINGGVDGFKKTIFTKILRKEKCLIIHKNKINKLNNYEYINDDDRNNIYSFGICIDENNILFENVLFHFSYHCYNCDKKYKLNHREIHIKFSLFKYLTDCMPVFNIYFQMIDFNKVSYKFFNKSIYNTFYDYIFDLIETENITYNIRVGKKYLLSLNLNKVDNSIIFNIKNNLTKLSKNFYPIIFYKYHEKLLINNPIAIKIHNFIGDDKEFPNYYDSIIFDNLFTDYYSKYFNVLDINKTFGIKLLKQYIPQSQQHKQEQKLLQEHKQEQKLLQEHKQEQKLLQEHKQEQKLLQRQKLEQEQRQKILQQQEQKEEQKIDKQVLNEPRKLRIVRPIKEPVKEQKIDKQVLNEPRKLRIVRPIKGGNYKEKYLKYKLKYLNEKNKLKK